MKSQFRSSHSRSLVQKQLATRPRYKIEKSANSHKMLTQQSTGKPLSSSEQRQMLGHLSEIPTEIVPRQSAVILPLCTNKHVPSILFIKRGSKRGSHRGQVGFPGGMFDEEDNEDPVVAAFRELEEEIGLTRNQVTYLGLHHDAGTSDQSRNRETGVVKSTIITPVIGMIDDDVSKTDFKLSLDELDYAFTVPLADLLDFNKWTTYKTRPAFNYTHQSVDEIILPRDDPSYLGCEFKLVDPDELAKIYAQQPPNEHKTNNHTTLRENPTMISLNQSFDTDQLTTAQLQYLEQLEGQGLYTDTAPRQHSSTQPESQTRQESVKVLHIPKTELIWGASAHITHLFLKQVLAPIYHDMVH